MTVISILFTFVCLFISPVDSRKCYECSCAFNWETNVGTCTSTSFLSSCTLQDVGNRYCFIISSYVGYAEQRVFESIAPDTFQDSHFIQAVEQIALSGTAWLPTAISSISYGCDWDGCNNISLSQYLPESFRMRIDQTILNLQLINGQLPAENCYTCSKCINDLTAILCRSVSCTNGFCYIDEIHNYIVTPANDCIYNFYSICQPFTDTVQTPSVRIRATYYIDFPQEKQLEIDEVDILCTKENCNSIETVEYLKGQIQTTVVIHSDFLVIRPNDTTTTTTRASTSTLTTTTTTKESTSTPTTSTSSASPLPTTTTTTKESTSTPPPSVTTTTTTTTTTTPGSISTKTYPIICLYLIAMLSLL